MKKLFFVLLGAGALALSSCGDDNGPTIEINSPADGTTYSGGDTLVIEGVATDDMEISSIDVEGMDGFSLSGSLDISEAPDVTNIPFIFSVVIDPASEAGDYSITVTATDNDGNADDDSVDFSVQ